MAYVDQLKAYGNLVLAYARVREAVLSRTQLKKLNEFAERLSSSKSQDEIIALNKALVAYTVKLFKKSEQSKKRQFIEQYSPTILYGTNAIEKKLAEFKQQIQLGFPQDEVTRLQFAIVGDPGVGKTSLVNRFVDSAFSPIETPTVGAAKKYVMHRGIKIDIYDVAGNEQYHSLVASHGEQSNVILVAFDVTNRASFERAAFWAEKITVNAPKDVKIMLIGTKTDLVEKRVVDFQTAQAFAKSKGWPYFETTAIVSYAASNVFKQVVTEARRMEDPQQKLFDRARLIEILKSPRWHALTSPGAKTPAGFKNIVNFIQKNPLATDVEILNEIIFEAGQRDDEEVSQRLFFNKRHPDLKALYHKLRNSEFAEDALQLLEDGLRQLEFKQDEIGATRRGPFR